jgi:hypothetical protein
LAKNIRNNSNLKGDIMKKSYAVSANVVSASGVAFGAMKGVKSNGIICLEGSETNFNFGIGKIIVTGKVISITKDGLPVYGEYWNKEMPPQVVDLDGSKTLSLSGKLSIFKWQGKIEMADDWNSATANFNATGWFNNIEAKATAVPLLAIPKTKIV